MKVQSDNVHSEIFATKDRGRDNQLLEGGWEGRGRERTLSIRAEIFRLPPIGRESALHRPNIEEFVARLAFIRARIHQSVLPTFVLPPHPYLALSSRRRNNHLLSRQVITTATML